MEVRVTGLESVINQRQRLLSLAPELGSQRREDTWEATWGSWRREKAGLGLEQEIEKERLDGKEERMEERDSMADLVLDRSAMIWRVHVLRSVSRWRMGWWALNV